jgi:hypothetical protein
MFKTTLFPQAPMSDCWDNIIVGMKVEVENRDADGVGSIFAEAYWVASVLRISGYKALLRYEGFGQVGVVHNIIIRLRLSAI